MSVLAALLAQALHVALMLLAAPTLAGFLASAEARLEGRPGPPLLQAWRELRRLARKRPLLAESASPVSRFAPIGRLATAAAAAALVPSFTLGMALAPIADLLAVAALFAAARAAAALAALDAGTARGGLIAGRTMRLALFGEPALLLATFTLALLAGSSNLDLIVALQREGLMQPAAASALAAAALVAVAISQSQHESDPELCASALATTRLADAFATLAWLDLIGAVFLPIGIAEAEGGAIAWLIGLVAWIVKLAILAIALAVSRRALSGRRPRATAEVLAIAGLLALVAAVFALAGASSA